MTDSTSISKMIQFAVDNGFRQIMVQVRGRGYAYYNSSLVEKAPYIKDTNFDPLAYAVQKGHAAGLKVHAWLNIYVLWSAPFKPKNPKHLLNVHPEWTEIDNRGVPDIKRMWSKKTYPGFFAGIFLAPTNPNVNPYLLNVIQEIVENYRIDGIHLDYIRYQGSQYGYNAAGRTAFKTRFGIDPYNVAKLVSKRRNVREKKQYQVYLDAWDKYRRDRVTSLVTHAKELCSSHNIQLSAAVKPNIVNARTKYLQDWEQWLKDGIIDFVIPMNYSKSSSTFMTNFHEILSQSPKDRIVMGIAVYNQSQFKVSENILKTLSAEYKGYCLFSYNTFADDPEYIKPLRHYLQLK